MQQKLATTITALGTLVLVLAVFPNLIDSKQFVEDKIWQDDSPIYSIFRIFNVTNPDEEKPIFEEVGPYVYRQIREKINITYNDPTNHTMQYIERKTYIFDQEKSGSNTEHDLVNIINIPFITVVHAIRSRLPELVGLVANQFLGTEKMIRRSVEVGELFFKGFDVSLYTGNPVLAPMLPEEFSGGLFCLYKDENGTDSKVYTVYTGVDNAELKGTIKEYDGKSTLGFWEPNTECDKVKGTDGYIDLPMLLADRKLDVFSTDICRSITFEYLEPAEDEGVYGYRFAISNWTLEDPRINPANRCYCLFANVEDCPKTGVMSLESCQSGAPIMVSPPYFLDAYEGYRNDSGLPPPVRDLHASYLDIEPISGALFRSHRRMQMNIDLKVGTGVNAFANLTKDIVFPLYWLDESYRDDV